MLVTTLLTLLSPIATTACASIVNNSASASASGLSLLFRAYKTHVWELPERIIGPSWLFSFSESLTKESVDRIESLLLGKAITTSPDILMMAARKGTYQERRGVSGFLLNYAIFKTFWHGSISLYEAQSLASCIWNEPGAPEVKAKFTNLFNNLATVKCDSDLFMVLATNIHMVHDAFSSLAVQHPDMVVKIIKEYVGDKRRNKANVPFRFLACLTSEIKYMLMDSRLVSKPSFANTDLFKIYSLSKLPEFSSANKRCIDSIFKCSFYEEKAPETKNRLSVPGMDGFDWTIIPRDVWPKIIDHCGLSFQICTFPAVCKQWKSLQRFLVSQTSTMEALVRSLDVSHRQLVLECRHYPWNHFLSSPQAVLRYILACLANKQLDFHIESRWIHKNWELVVREINENRLSMSSQSYVELYLRCCKAVNRPLEFYQLPGMSGREYAAWIKSLIEQHNTIPAIPGPLLGKECGSLVQILEDHSCLITKLFQNEERCYDRLVVHLLLTKSSVPSAVDEVLCKASALYRSFTKVGDRKAKESLGLFILKNVSNFDQDILARSIVDFCLAAESESSSRISNPSWEIWDCLGKSGMCGIDCNADTIHQMTNPLSSSVVKFLCDRCNDYSEEQFSTIEKKLVRLGIFDDCSETWAINENVGRLLRDPHVAIKLVNNSDAAERKTAIPCLL